MKILVVDDDFLCRTLMQELLANLGEILAASSGSHALDICGRELQAGDPVRLVLLDIMMPEMDGYEVLRRLRAMGTVRWRPLVVMTTALSDPVAIERALHTDGCDGYLTKPILRDQLFTELRRLGLLH